MRSRWARRAGLLLAFSMTFLASTALAAPNTTAAPGRVAAADSADDRWRGSGVDSDFNGDGFADLAVAAQDWSRFSEELDTLGTVSIIYGSRDGLTRKRTQTWHTSDLSAGARDDDFGSALAPGDFDGDGFADLAIGTSRFDGDGPGRVWVLYGSAAGLTRARTQQWTEDSPGVAGVAEAGDNFGMALVAADFGRGRQDDLAVGTSGEDVAAGAVTMLYGTPAGLSPVGSQLFTQATPGIPGQRAAMENFGDTLAAADIGRSRHADLVVGVWGDNVGGQEEAGSVNVLYGSATGLTTAGAQLWNQRTKRVSGKARGGDRCGFSLATGDFDGDAIGDVAISCPDDGNGKVHVLYGKKRHGLSAKDAQTLSGRTRGLASRRNLGYFFGLTLTTGDFGRNGSGGPYTDLALRADQKMRENEASQAVVIVIPGGKSGLRAKASRAWTLDSPGVKGTTSSSGTDTGASMTVGDFGKNRGGRRLDDLALGNGLSSGHDDPAVNVLYGSSKGLTARGDQRWTGSSIGHRELEEFGWVLAAR